METISVIIPAYNASSTIERCIKSVLSQTYSDFCIYIVDDCSSDNTWDVLCRMAKDESRVKIFRNKSNSGPSVSRNKALAQSKGKWVSFIDSDDYICPNFFETMLDASNDVNIVVGSFESVDENGRTLQNYNVTDDYRSSDITTALNKAYGGDADLDFIYNLCCNKLYKRNLFECVKFPEGRLQEDAYVMPYLIYAANGKVGIAKEAMYYYVDNSQSISHIGQMGIADLKRRIDLVHLYNDHIGLYQSYGNELYKRSRANLINNIITIFRLHYAAYYRNSVCDFKWLIKTFKSNYLKSIKEGNEYLSKPLLFTLMLFFMSPKLYLKVFS